MRRRWIEKKASDKGLGSAALALVAFLMSWSFLWLNACHVQPFIGDGLCEGGFQCEPPTIFISADISSTGPINLDVESSNDSMAGQDVSEFLDSGTVVGGLPNSIPDSSLSLTPVGDKTCGQVNECVWNCTEDEVQCKKQCFDEGAKSAKDLYVEVLLCREGAFSYFEYSHLCPEVDAECYYDAVGPMNCAQAFSCVRHCKCEDGKDCPCGFNCLVKSTYQAQVDYLGVVYCINGLCAESDDPDCHENNRVNDGACQEFVQTCGIESQVE